MQSLPTTSLYFASVVALVAALSVQVAADDGLERRIRSAVTLYASFDDRVEADVGGGTLKFSTRFDHPAEKGRYIFEPGFDAKAFRIAKGKGVHGGALQVVDVLPRRGRIFFPARGNIAYEPDGWGGAVSFWLSTNPNTMLKTRFCDPVQITEQGAGNGGLWCDFPDTRPRDFRLGAFPALAPDDKPISQSDPAAPLIRVKEIGFKAGTWHHVVMNWNHFDTGQPNAQASLFIDGELISRLDDRELAMKWNLDKTGIYIAVNYIGLLDELAVYKRPLHHAEIAHLSRQSDTLSPLKE